MIVQCLLGLVFVKILVLALEYPRI